MHLVGELHPAEAGLDLRAAQLPELGSGCGTRGGGKGAGKEDGPTALGLTLRVKSASIAAQTPTGEADSKSFTSPLDAFHPKWPPAMYRASKPALRRTPAVSHPMWNP